MTYDTETPPGSASVTGEPEVCHPSVNSTISGATLESRDSSAPASRRAAVRSVLFDGGGCCAPVSWARAPNSIVVVRLPGGKAAVARSTHARAHTCWSGARLSETSIANTTARPWPAGRSAGWAAARRSNATTISRTPRMPARSIVDALRSLARAAKSTSGRLTANTTNTSGSLRVSDSRTESTWLGFIRVSQRRATRRRGPPGTPSGTRATGHLPRCSPLSLVQRMGTWESVSGQCPIRRDRTPRHFR